MKRELGIGRCGLACCLCSENEHCRGCSSGDCPDKDWCENRRCTLEKGLGHCFECDSDCRKGLLAKIKPYGFTLFARRYGEEKLLGCLERNEKNGIVYHRDGISGDYDEFDDADKLIDFIRSGRKPQAQETMKTSDIETDGVLAYGVTVGRFTFSQQRRIVYALTDCLHVGPSDVTMVYQISRADYDKLLKWSRPHGIPEPPVPAEETDCYHRYFLCGESAYCQRSEFTLDDVNLSLTERY